MPIALIRHGQTDWNFERRLQGTTDIPLNETGRAQARAVAPKLEAMLETEGWAGGWDAVVSSPLGRARETAALIAEGLGVDLGPAYPMFIERHYGEAEGATAAEVEAKWPHRDYPGMESAEHVVERGLLALDRLSAEFGDANVVAVSHGTLIRYTLNDFADPRIDLLENGSISVVDRVDGEWTVLSAGASRVPEASRTHHAPVSAGSAR